MDHEIAVLKAQRRLYYYDNLNLQQKLRDKNREILLLKRQIRRLELKVPKRIDQYQLSLADFAD